MTIENQSAAGASTRCAGDVFNRQSPIANRQSRSGIALVITLILLSVTLVMAVAFLALSRRDRNAVATTTDTAMARLAADSALAAAQAQIAANIFFTNSAAYNFSLLVSTNYINGDGFYFTGGPNSSGPANPTNVSYVYPNGNLVGGLGGADFIQNAANLLFLPRAPVFAPTNQPPYGYDFRYYLDLNRNGRYETNGNIQEFDNSGNAIGNPSLHVGDPEWIGVLERPDQPHGPNNHFIARYAFLAQPIGNGLDLNYIHNQTRNGNLPNLISSQDGYFRNEGVGSWELNLAAFLADLNTNVWDTLTSPYFYGQPSGNFNTGNAFFDAFSLLNWRYASSYSSLTVPLAYFYDGLAKAGVDGFAMGFLMTTPVLPNVFQPAITTPWAGSDNTNRFFSLSSDLFDASKTAVGVSPANVAAGNYFTGRLLNAGTNTYGGTTVPTYDRYTFYRLLDQLGTDSSADAGKMNLNYDNLDPYIHIVSGNTVTNPPSETNLMAWTPLGFFTNAADRMLRYYTTQWATNLVRDPFNADTNFVATFNITDSFGVSHIPVWVSNQLVYSSAVHRLLQVAANLYDASTNASYPFDAFYPSVFRPTFLVTNQNGFNTVYIDGYEQITSVRDASDPVLGSVITIDVLAGKGPGHYVQNVYGVPWIIGAKKFMPNFNQFTMRNDMKATRKLQLWRFDTSTGPQHTNEMFIMSITNHMGFSFWNSYASNYPGGPLTIFLSDTLQMTMSLTNDLGQVYTRFASTNFTHFVPNITPWNGAGWPAPGSGRDPLAAPPNVSQSFQYTTCDFQFLPESQYRYLNNDFIQGSINSTSWERSNDHVYPLPGIGIATTNQLMAFILDGTHVVDYVVLGGPNGARGMNDSKTFNDADLNKSGYDYNHTPIQYSFWDTNVNRNGIVYDVADQIFVSKSPPSYLKWQPANKAKEVPNFINFLNSANLGGSYTNLEVQVPYTPSRLAWDYTLWQANDPLVHYLASDLNTIIRGGSTPPTGPNNDDLTVDVPDPYGSLASVGSRYQPWGLGTQMDGVGNDDTLGQVDKNHFNLAYRDPLVWGSDYWNFPNGKYPNAGWIGRVHRGTPWQTLYLKATNIFNLSSSSANGAKTWAYWTGNTKLLPGNLFFDAGNADPVQDRFLFDLFTARFNDNGAHGTLSVNQTHLAAWSAVLSGVVALTNTTVSPLSYRPVTLTNLIVSPAGAGGLSSSTLGTIVNNINATRTSFANADGVVGTFEHAGDILRVPTLSEQSPFLHLSNFVNNAWAVDTAQKQNGISDAVYEWLPQQIMGLLRVSTTPRYVVYCYGQALRPAPGSQVLTGNYFQMVTNYQVVAESAARAVIRVDRILVTNLSAVPPVVIKNYTTTVESYNPLPPN